MNSTNDAKDCGDRADRPEFARNDDEPGLGASNQTAGEVGVNCNLSDSSDDERRLVVVEEPNIDEDDRERDSHDSAIAVKNVENTQPPVTESAVLSSGNDVASAPIAVNKSSGTGDSPVPRTAVERTPTHRVQNSPPLLHSPYFFPRINRNPWPYGSPVPENPAMPASGFQRPFTPFFNPVNPNLPRYWLTPENSPAPIPTPPPRPPFASSPITAHSFSAYSPVPMASAECSPMGGFRPSPTSFYLPQRSPFIIPFPRYDAPPIPVHPMAPPMPLQPETLPCSPDTAPAESVEFGPQQEKREEADLPTDPASPCPSDVSVSTARSYSPVTARSPSPIITPPKATKAVITTQEKQKRPTMVEVLLDEKEKMSQQGQKKRKNVGRKRRSAKMEQSSGEGTSAGTALAANTEPKMSGKNEIVLDKIIYTRISGNSGPLLPAAMPRQSEEAAAASNKGEEVVNKTEKTDSKTMKRKSGKRRGRHPKKDENTDESNEGSPKDAVAYYEEGEDTTLYCKCRKTSYGKMVACDYPECKIEWFHYGCVGLSSNPVGEWYCEECKLKQELEKG